MLKTLSGMAAGVFIAQEYPSDIPRIKPIIQTFLSDLQTKSIQYTVQSTLTDSNKPK